MEHVEGICTTCVYSRMIAMRAYISGMDHMCYWLRMACTYLHVVHKFSRLCFCHRSFLVIDKTTAIQNSHHSHSSSRTGRDTSVRQSKVICTGSNRDFSDTQRDRNKWVLRSGTDHSFKPRKLGPVMSQELNTSQVQNSQEIIRHRAMSTSPRRCRGHKIRLTRGCDRT